MNDAEDIGMDVQQATISVAVRDSRASRTNGSWPSNRPCGGDEWF
jgi:hypothetical protein